MSISITFHWQIIWENTIQILIKTLERLQIKNCKHLFLQWIIFGTCVPKASPVECWSIPLNDTLDQHLIDTPSIPRLTRDGHSIDISVNSRLIFDWCMWVAWHLALTTDRLMIKCRPSIDWVVDEVLIKGIDWHLTVDTFSTQDPYIFSTKGMRARIIITPMPQFNVLAFSMTSTIFITGKINIQLSARRSFTQTDHTLVCSLSYLPGDIQPLQQIQY